MGKNFVKIKTRALIVRLLKAFFLGASSFLAFVGVANHLKKFEILTLPFDKINLISVIIFSAISIGVYFILYTSDRALARRIDREYKLGERVQTMLAFKGDDSAIAELQREDANKIISRLRLKELSLKKLWWHILLLILGAGMLVASIKIDPPVIPEPVVPEEPYAVTQFQLDALAELITQIEQSEMQEPYRATTVASLKSLFDEIDDVTTVKAKDELVGRVMDDILKCVDESSLALELMEALWATKDLRARLLARALNYYEWPKNDTLEAMTNKFLVFRTSLSYTLGDGETKEQRIEFFKEILLGAGGSVTLALRNSQMSEDDPLYKVLARLADAKEIDEEIGTRVYGLNTVAQLLEELGYENAQKELDATATALVNELYRSLEGHSVNTSTGEGAVTRISALFECRAPILERPNLAGSLDGDEAGNGGSGGGGIGNGTVYGSDDLVFDPMTGRYVEYGEIIDRYQSLMFSQLENGEYTEEERKAIDKYFKILYGIKDETEE